MKTPPDRATLEAIVGALEDQPAELVRKDKFFKDQGYDADDYVTADSVVGLLLEHPRLMQRPVFMRDGRAVIGRPPGRVTEILA